MVAALEGHVEVVQWLLHHETVALLDARDDLGCTALILAVQSGNIEVAFALLDAGANVAIASNDGTTALTACLGVGMVERLLELGLDMHARDEDGMDALLLACRRGDAEVVSLLIEHRASVYTRDDAGATALMHACDGGHIEVVESCSRGQVRMAVKTSEARGKDGFTQATGTTTTRGKLHCMWPWRRTTPAACRPSSTPPPTSTRRTTTATLRCTMSAA